MGAQGCLAPEKENLQMKNVTKFMPIARNAIAAAPNNQNVQHPRVDADPDREKRNRRQLPTEWPKVGGAGLNIRHTDAFMSEAFRDTYVPGQVRMVYAAGCPGLCEVGKASNVPQYKISTCSEDRAGARMYELNKDEVGACVYRDGAYAHEEGWDGWFPSHLHPQRGPSPQSPVTVQPRCLLVRLDASMSAEAFDEQFDARVRLGCVSACNFGSDANLVQRFVSRLRQGGLQGDRVPRARTFGA